MLMEPFLLRASQTIRLAMSNHIILHSQKKSRGNRKTFLRLPLGQVGYFCVLNHLMLKGRLLLLVSFLPDSLAAGNPGISPYYSFYAQ